VGSPSFKLSGAERLKKREEIRRVFSQGRRVSCSGAKLFILKNSLEVNRIAFTFTKKYGCAVERNRSKRLSREAYRISKAGLRRGFDFVLLVYPGGDVFHTRVKQLGALFFKAGLAEDGITEKACLHR
jgi:ribonuclease P protein component